MTRCRRWSGMRVLWSAVVLCFAALACPVPSFGQDGPSRSGTFTEFRASQKTGEIHGLELMIVPVPGGYQGILQRFEGVPLRLVLADLEVHGRRISFTFTDERDGKVWAFLGEILADRLIAELRVKGSADATIHILMRGRGSVWD